MLEVIDINEDYFKEQLEQARASNASAKTFAGIYSHMADYYLGEATQAYVANITRNTNLNDPKFAKYVAEDGSRHVPIDISERWDNQYIDYSDIAKKEGDRLVISGKKNIGEYYRRQKILHQELQPEIYAQEGYKRIATLQDHEWSSGEEKKQFAALSKFTPGYQGNPYTGLAEVEYFCKRAAEGVCADSPQGREKIEFDREIGRLVKDQEGLITKLAQRLLQKRQAAITELTVDTQYAEPVKEKLGKALEAANQAVQYMDSDMKARSVSQHGAG